MPGASSNSPLWGAGPLVVDTSAWSRAAHPVVRDQWISALLGDRLRLSPVVGLEILLSPRDGASFDILAKQLAALRPAPLTTSVVRAAQTAMRALAHRSAGAQRIPVVDYLVAAGAQELAAAVIHYDGDYDVLAGVMEFESVWLAPVGSIE